MLLFKYIQIKWKLTLSIGIIAILGIVGVGLISYFTAGKIVKMMAKDELHAVTDSTYNMVKISLDNVIKNYLRAIAEKTRLMVKFYHEQYTTGVLTEQEAYTRVKELILDPGFAQIGATGYLAGVNGKGVLVIHPKSEGMDASQFEFMQKALAMKHGYLEYMWKNVGEEQERPKAGWIEYYESWDLIIWATSYKSEFLSLINIEDFRTTISSIIFGKTGYMYVINSRGDIIIHPELAGQSAYYFEDANTGHFFIQEICDQKNGELTYYWKNPSEQTARQKIVIYKYIEELDWILCSGIYVDELFEPVSNLGMTTMILLGVFSLLALALSLILGKTISKPINHLCTVVARFSEANFSVRAAVETRDEVGELANAFNTMASQLQTNFQTLQTEITHRKQIEQERTLELEALQHIMNQVINTAERLDSSSASMIQISAQMAAEAEQTARQVALVSSNSHQINQSVHNVSVVTEEVATNIREISRNVQEVVDIITKAVNVASSANTTIVSLETQSQEIGDIIQVITDITQQTNLLALNATIEAARAGEFGKGFAVVANEVKELAHETARSAGNITRKIEMIQSSSQETANAITEVVQIINQVSELSTAIATAIAQQSQSTNEISRSIHDIAQGSEGITHTIEDVTTTAQDSSAQAASVQLEAQELYALAEQLRQLVERSKT